MGAFAWASLLWPLGILWACGVALTALRQAGFRKPWFVLWCWVVVFLVLRVPLVGGLALVLQDSGLPWLQEWGLFLSEAIRSWPIFRWLQPQDTGATASLYFHLFWWPGWFLMQNRSKANGSQGRPASKG